MQDALCTSGCVCLKKNNKNTHLETGACFAWGRVEMAKNKICKTNEKSLKFL